MNNWVLARAERAMLHHLGMPESLWAGAFSTVTYIGNRTPAKALDGRTYYEILCDVKLDLANLRALDMPCAIVGQIDKLKKRAWTVSWATSIGGAHVMHIHEYGRAKLAHCGRSLRVLSTSANRCYFES